MAKLVFRGEDVRVLFDHAKASKQHSPTFGMLCTAEYLKEGEKLEGEYAKSEQIDLAKVPAHLQLVKDAGAYLMSSGIPRLPGLPKDGKPAMNFVVYAKGFEEGCDWGMQQAALGGDDFVEPLTLDMFEPAMADKASKIWLNVSKNRISIGWEPGEGAPAKTPREKRVRPAYDSKELGRVNKEAGATTRAAWAFAGGTYKGVICEVTPVLVYQKVRRGIVVHERALLPDPVPAKGQIVAYVYPDDVNAKASFGAK